MALQASQVVGRRAALSKAAWTAPFTAGRPRSVRAAAQRQQAAADFKATQAELQRRALLAAGLAGAAAISLPAG